MPSKETDPTQLTPRESDVFSLLEIAFTVDEIAEQLNIDRTTVNTNIATIKRKTGKGTTRIAGEYAASHRDPNAPGIETVLNDQLVPVASLLGLGLLDKEISQELNLPLGTVKDHVGKITRALLPDVGPSKRSKLAAKISSYKPKENKTD